MPQRNGIPRYRCFKEVQALKILDVRLDPGTLGATLTFGDPWPTLKLNHEDTCRFSPRGGGYWVWYADGYQSFSPGAAFEAGYALVP